MCFIPSLSRHAVVSRQAALSLLVTLSVSPINSMRVREVRVDGAADDTARGMRSTRRRRSRLKPGTSPRRMRRRRRERGRTTRWSLPRKKKRSTFAKSGRGRRVLSCFRALYPPAHSLTHSLILRRLATQYSRSTFDLNGRAETRCTGVVDVRRNDGRRAKALGSSRKAGDADDGLEGECFDRSIIRWCTQTHGTKTTGI